MHIPISKRQRKLAIKCVFGDISISRVLCHTDFLHGLGKYALIVDVGGPHANLHQGRCRILRQHPLLQFDVIAESGTNLPDEFRLSICIFGLRVLFEIEDVSLVHAAHL